MRLKPSSPSRKSSASLHAALRALMVSACALTAPAALSHTSVLRRSVIPSPKPATHPYLSMLVPTPLRFAAPERPPVVLKIEPLPETDQQIADAAEAEAVAAAAKAAATAHTNGFLDLPNDFNFSLPTTTELDASIAATVSSDVTPTRPEDSRPEGPPPILLSEETMIGARPEDIMPFFRLPSVPSKATYTKE